MFSIEKAKAFYLDYLGFQIDWEHRFAEGSPLYMQVSRGDILLHLSEHYGDGVPGTAIFIPTTNLEEFYNELLAKPYKYLHPGIIEQEWGKHEMHLIDPFGNRLRFGERIH